MAAAAGGHLEVVQYLVEHGADIHARNNTALKLTTGGGHIEVAAYLRTLP